MTPRNAASITLEYCNDVLSGKVIAGKFIKLACARHLRDLQTAKERGYYFSEKAAQHVVDFFQKYLRHSKGEWAGQPFVLEPWQIFCLSVEFGWLRYNTGKRRFRLGWTELPRKNGKSTLNSGKGLYLFAADDEPGAEIYAAATKKDQAKIIWSEAVRMVKASPDLGGLIQRFHSSLIIPHNDSKFEPLGADSSTLDGLNVHAGLLDEVHAHRDRGVFDIIETGTGARSQSLIDMTTTAGSNRHSIAFELHTHGTHVLEGIIEDDTFFVFIATIDEKDDWRDPEVHAKANPNYGKSVKIADLEAKCKRAIQMPNYENTFKRLHLNVWTEQAVRWLNMEEWDACVGQVSPEELRNCPCWGGLDLSSTTDLTAEALIFPVGNQVKVLPFFFMPEDNIELAERRDHVPYGKWCRDGFITPTPGNVVDYDFVQATTEQNAERYDLKELAFDRYGSTQISLKLKDKGINVVPFGQGYLSMSLPSKQLARLVLSHRLEHGGNPVLRWMAANVAVQTDKSPAENIKPVKDESTGRIDGIVATIMGLGARDLSPVEQSFVYNERGIFIG